MQSPHLKVLYTCANSVLSEPDAKAVMPRNMQKASRRSDLGLGDGSETATEEGFGDGSAIATEEVSGGGSWAVVVYGIEMLPR